FNDIGALAAVGNVGLAPGTNNNISADPVLGPLAPIPNGTRAYVLSNISPVLDQIPAASAPTIDQAGNPPPKGTKSDMGAIEGTNAGTISGTGTGTGSGSGSGSGTGTGTGSGTGGQSVAQQVNQLVLANLRAVFAQPLPPSIAFAVIVSQTIDVNKD